MSKQTQDNEYLAAKAKAKALSKSAADLRAKNSEVFDIQGAIAELVEAAHNLEATGKFSREILGRTFNAVDKLNQATPEQLAEVMAGLDSDKSDTASLLTGVLIAHIQGTQENKKTQTNQRFTNNESTEEYEPCDY